MKSNFLATLRWAFSPCPNDTFIFGPLATGLLLDDAPISPTLADIDELNAIALRGEADVIKVSAAAVPSFGPTYQVLPCGGAMGEGVGPLLVRREDDHTPISPSSRVAHPGRLTTAFALFRLFHPEVSQLQEMLFSDIEPAVRHGEVSHGLLIHEGRFTYQAHRLHAEEDLGRRWENEYRLPLPLGLILVRRSLPQTVKTAVREAISRSLCYAWANPQMVMPYVATHAQEMDEEVQQKHINLYVNRYSETIGMQGETALRTLWSAVAKDSQPAERDLFFRD